MDEITNTEVPTQATSVPAQQTSVPAQQEQSTEKAPEVATESPKEEPLNVEKVQTIESEVTKESPKEESLNVEKVQTTEPETAKESLKEEPLNVEKVQTTEPEVTKESLKEEPLNVEKVQTTESVADQTFIPNAENTSPLSPADNTADTTTTSPATTEKKPYEHKPAYQRSNDNYHQRNNDRGDGYRKPDKFERNSFSKDRDMRGGSSSKFKKYDKIAAKKLDINYKKPEILQDFLTEKGKILSRLITGCSAQNQHKLTREVKRARFIGLLPSA